MPLFECKRCGAVENTALGQFWVLKPSGDYPLCSECATGTWHGEFEKQNAAEAGYVHGKSGYLYRPEELNKGGYFHKTDQLCECGDVQAHYQREGS